MNFMQFCHQKGNFSNLNLRFAYFVRSKMSIEGIIMFLGMNNTRLERKILIILNFENGFLPTYLPLCLGTECLTDLFTVAMMIVSSNAIHAESKVLCRDDTCLDCKGNHINNRLVYSKLPPCNKTLISK